MDHTLHLKPASGATASAWRRSLLIATQPSGTWCVSWLSSTHAGTSARRSIAGTSIRASIPESRCPAFFNNVAVEIHQTKLDQVLDQFLGE